MQGVGFRFTAEALARDLGLSGWVKNLADGRVELVCEGRQEDLKQILNRIDRQFAGFVHQKAVNWMDASSEFNGFEIRFF